MSDMDTAIAYILQGDPTVTGWQLPIASFGYSFTTSKLYIKTGGDPTNWTEVGGGAGTVTADAPLTGNGSSGSHLALSAATTSTPGSMAATDFVRLRDITLSELTTAAGGTVTDMTISGLTGDSDGDYEFEGYIKVAAAGNPTFSLQPNGVATNQTFHGAIVYSAVSFLEDAFFRIHYAQDATTEIWFRGTMQSRRTGSARLYTVSASRSGSAAPMTVIGAGHWLEAATEITSLRVHSSAASGILNGSYFTVRKLHHGV